MKSLLVDTLKKIYPAYPQGSLAPEEYPATFFTYWNYETIERFYSNDPVRADWGFWVYCYSEDPRILKAALEEATEALRSAGFIIADPGTDADSGKRSHIGRMITVKYIESY